MSRPPRVVVWPRTLSVSPQALALLAEQPFRGNVRELRNLLERTTLLCDGDRIEAEHVAQALNSGRRGAVVPAVAAPVAVSVTANAAPHSATPAPASAPEAAAPSLQALELAALRERVAAHTGSRAELAAALGISERSLYRKLKALS